MQQYRSYIKSNISKPKPKQRCLQDLAKFIEKWKSTYEESSIILMMDANGDSSDNHFQTFIRDTNLKDVVAYYSPEIKDQSTYINGQKRIDYILVSDDLLGAGSSAGHTAFLQPFISDHRAVYWDVATSHLFGSTEGGKNSVPHRGLQLERPSTVETYIVQLNRLYDRHRILERAQKLEEQILESTDRHRLQHLYSKFSKLDWERIRYMKRAEALCKQRKNRAYEWSPTLIKMGGRV